MEERRIAFEIIELEEDSFHILTRVELPSGEEGYMIIDTGASKTVLDMSFVGEGVEMQPNESTMQSGGLGGTLSDIFICSLDYLVIDTFRIESPSLAVIDLSNLNELYFAHCNKKISALLGSDLLLKYRAIIDYGKSEMIFFE